MTPPRITIQVSLEELRALDDAAHAQGRTRSGMLRWLMNEGLEPSRGVAVVDRGELAGNRTADINDPSSAYAGDHVIEHDPQWRPPGSDKSVDICSCPSSCSVHGVQG